VTSNDVKPQTKGYFMG